MVLTKQYLHPGALSPETLRLLLYACRVVELGLSEDQFAKVVSLQKRVKESCYRGLFSVSFLTVEELALCSDLWHRLHAYAEQKKLGYEHLTDLLQCGRNRGLTVEEMGNGADDRDHSPDD